MTGFDSHGTLDGHDPDDPGGADVLGRVEEVYGQLVSIQ